MIKSFKFAGADFKLANLEEKTPKDLILTHFNTICLDDTVSTVYDIFPSTDAPIIEGIINDIFEFEPEVSEKMETYEEKKKIDRNFEHLDHTADIQIHAWGGDLREAFINAALGMVDYMVPLERIEPVSEVLIQARGNYNLILYSFGLIFPKKKSTSSSATNKNEFLFNFMQEVLYAAACEPYFMAREIEIVDFNFETRKIRAKLRGENFESRRHGGEGKSPILSTKQSVDVQIIETLKRY